jgi:hypothetical protein
MALNTPAQVVADWIELRDDILPLVEEEGLPGGALDAAVALAVIQGDGGGGGGGATAAEIGEAVDDALRATPLAASSAQLPPALGAGIGAESLTTVTNSDALILASLTITRANNSVSYAANTHVADDTGVFLALANASRANGASGYFVNAMMMVAGATFNTPLRLHIFRVAPTFINDNASYTTLVGNNANRVGFIDFTSWTAGGSGSNTAMAVGQFSSGGAFLPFNTASDSRNLICILETRGAFSGTANQTFELAAWLDRG